MTDNPTMKLRHLYFIGPTNPPAFVEFRDGLNLIYGPSNTGKSSILDAIDFMLGRERKLKEIPEHVGYSEVLLALEFSDDSTFTLVRPLRGGSYKLFEGLHKDVPQELNYEVLREGKSTKKEKSLSEFILGKIGLFDKKLKKNAKNETENLTIRTFLPLFMVNDTDIQKEISPFLSGQYTKKTVELSRLRLLLTGVDDSSLVPEKALEKERISRSARTDILNELIQDINTKISEASHDEITIEELRDQNDKLDESIQTANDTLLIHQSNYTEALSLKNKEQRLYREAIERRDELNVMIERFGLLLEHYQSDIYRLDGIIESGSLISALSTDVCPLCGASQEVQNTDHYCDGDIDGIVEAAKAEKGKIESLRSDLEKTLLQIEDELKSVDQSIENRKENLTQSSDFLHSMEPDLTQSRTNYSELIMTKSYVSKKIDLFETLEDLQTRLEQSRPEHDTEEQDETDNKAPEASLFELAGVIRSLLNKWNLPNSEHVHFSDETTDLVINGKHRSSNGKGHRSITHVSATLGLSKYLEDKKLPRFGCVLLDSPLIAYEEPDEVDEISATDLNEKFFEYLRDWKSTQTIIFENKKSITDEVKKLENVTHFTKNKKIDRYGFFPI